MYLPKRFENENFEESFALIQKYPLATVISTTEQGPFVSHIPLVIEKTKEDLILIGHLARGNPHWKLIEDRPVYVIFHGPNAYMTPKWYAENDVPTWNYAVVHIDGVGQLIQDLDGILSCLKKLSSAAEANFQNPWEFWIPDDLAAPGVIEKSIVGFQIKVTSLKSKFKLNQSRSKADLERSVQGLLRQNTDTARAMAETMAQAWKAYNNSADLITLPENQKIMIRRAKLSEADLLSALAMRSKSYWPYSADYLTKSVALLKIQESDIKEWPVCVAELNDEVVGFFALKSIKCENRLDHLWIDPRYIGQGIGKILFLESKMAAQHIGWKSFRLVAEPYAEAFYIKMGAKNIGSIQSRVKPDFFLPHMEVHF